MDVLDNLEKSNFDGEVKIKAWLEAIGENGWWVYSPAVRSCTSYGASNFSSLPIFFPYSPLCFFHLSFPFSLSPALPSFFLSLTYKVYKGICIYKGIITSISWKFYDVWYVNHGKVWHVLPTKSPYLPVYDPMSCTLRVWNKICTSRCPLNAHWWRWVRSTSLLLVQEPGYFFGSNKKAFLLKVRMECWSPSLAFQERRLLARQSMGLLTVNKNCNSAWKWG